MIRAALFDFGGVLLTSPFDAFSRFERERGLPAGFIQRVNATNHHDNAWAHLERGDVTFDEFCERFEDECRRLGHEVSGREVLGLLYGDLRPPMVDAVRRCRAAGLGTALLTNNVAPIGDHPVRADVADVLDLFDVVVESSVEGVRKPEPAFYERACARLGIEPAEAVFLDDLGVNLKPARAMGMVTIKVGDPDAALMELESVVGVPLR